MDKDCIIIFLILVLIITMFTKRNIGYKENFNRRFELPWFNKNDYINTEITDSVNTEFTDPVNTTPYRINIISNSGEKKISINSINGFKVGDVISINPNNENAEAKTVTGIGNGILSLDNILSYTHRPNEPVYNMSNKNINYDSEDINTKQSQYYADINNDGKLSYNSPSDPWGKIYSSAASCEFKINGECQKYPVMNNHNWFPDQNAGGPQPSTLESCKNRKLSWQESCNLDSNNIEMRYMPKSTTIYGEQNIVNNTPSSGYNNTSPDYKTPTKKKNNNEVKASFNSYITGAWMYKNPKQRKAFRQSAKKGLDENHKKGNCIPKNSLENNCTPCLDSSQCKQGGFCCPFMKKCVKTPNQQCNYPIANCRPRCSTAECNSCKNPSYNNGTWQKNTCK